MKTARKFWFFSVLIVLGFLLIAGCGGKATVKTPEGEVEVSEKKGEVKVKTEEGEATYSQKEVTEEDLGVPIYPGAKITDGGGGSIKTRGEKGEAEFVAATFVTPDSIDRVIEWYRNKLSGKPKFTDLTPSMGGEKTGMFSFEAGSTVKTIIISMGDEDHPGKTMIAISSGTGEGYTPQVK